jgi:hypothetical protein
MTRRRERADPYGHVAEIIDPDHDRRRGDERRARPRDRIRRRSIAERRILDGIDRRGHEQTVGGDEQELAMPPSLSPPPAPSISLGAVAEFSADRHGRQFAPHGL